MADSKIIGQPKDTRPIPDWIDAALLQQALRNGGFENSQVADVSVSYATSPGDNYGSTIYRAKATLSDGEQRSFIVKGPPPGANISSLAAELGVFQREIIMLGDVIPKMEALLEEAAPGRFPPLAPRCYHHGTSPVEFLVLEDLAPPGFKMADRKRGLGLRHSLLALRTLARFHAASYTVLQREPGLAEKLDNIWRKMSLGLTGYVDALIRGSVAAGRTWPGFEEYADRLEKFKEVAMDTYVKLNEPQPGAFNVITHGDYWIINFLFRYEDGIPTDIRALDYQMTRVASPAVDLTYFLASSVRDDVHARHQEMLLREYHLEFRNTMELLGQEAPPLEALQSALDFHGPYSLFVALAKPILVAERGNNTEAMMTGDNSQMLPLFQHPDVKKWLQRVIPDYAQLQSYRELPTMAQQTANEIVSVPWIDKAFILKALRNSGDSKSNVTDVTVRYAVASGENYSSTIYRVEAALDDGRQQSFMVKGPPPGEELATFAKMSGIFWREGSMMADLIPQMEALLEAATPNKLPRFSARCLLYGCEDTVDFVVMEDLADSGFKMADRKRGLGLRHTLLALRSLARFHAASHALLRQKPELADSYDNMWRRPNHNMSEFIQGLVQSAADVCCTWNGFEKFVDILQKLKPDIMDLCTKINDPKPDSFNVITHGDFWVNNMMYRYENGEPVELRMVDLQISHVASPAIDLLYFLTTSVSDDVYLNHRDLVLREYLFSLEETLELLGIKAPPREAFLAAIHDHGIMAVFGALCIKPIALTQSTPDLEASNVGDHSGIAFMYQTPHIKRWLQTTLQEFSQKGWLKE